MQAREGTVDSNYGNKACLDNQPAIPAAHLSSGLLTSPASFARITSFMVLAVADSKGETACIIHADDTKLHHMFGWGKMQTSVDITTQPAHTNT